jgi:hypothetical protein
MNKKKFIYFISIFLVLMACVGKSSNFSKIEIKSILLSWSIPIYDPELKKVSNMRDSVLIYYFDDLVLYRVSYTYTKYNKNAQKGNTNIVSDDPKTIEFREIRFKNYIHKSGYSTGFVYDSLNTNYHLVFNVDSFQRKKTFNGSNFYDTSHDKLLQTNLYKDKSTFVEKWGSVTKLDESYSDTSYYYFNRSLNNIPYSFSKKADSIKNMKLSGIKFIYNIVRESSNGQVKIPKREITIEIKKNPIGNSNEIVSLFQMFKNDFYNAK